MLGTQKQSLSPAAATTATVWSAHPTCCSYSSNVESVHPVVARIRSWGRFCCKGADSARVESDSGALLSWQQGLVSHSSLCCYHIIATTSLQHYQHLDYGFLGNHCAAKFFHCYSDLQISPCFTIYFQVLMTKG